MLPDFVPDHQPQGLLASISEEDLKDTDVYVYRQSNGQMILERKGLWATGNSKGQFGGLLPDATGSNTEGRFYYRSTVRGRYGHGTYFGYQFDTWQVKAKMNPAFYQKESDHLRVGEDVKIIAINRKTGYIGSVVTTVGNAATGEGDAAAQANNRIDFPIGEIIMRPPNIKIKVEREYTVEAGLTQGEKRQYLVGFEGTATKSDQSIKLSTEWLDHDGSLLPPDLPGYTARIAKITSDKTLGDNIAEFPVRPGFHLEWIDLPKDVAISNDHFYLHVNGKPPEDSPDFSLLKTTINPDTNQSSTETAGPGILQYRPRHYVPIKVAMFDEAETRRRENEQRQAEAAGATHTTIPPVYVWQHRPEMQFSVLELVMNQINRTDADGNVIDILPAGSDTDPNTIPGLASSDTSVDLLYDLQTSPYDPLDPFGYSNPNLTTQNPGNTFARDIILALGTEEALATFGAGQEAIFNNPDHLSYLSPEDFLTISMYQNSDSANILWEFAFEYLAVFTPEDIDDAFYQDRIFLSADNPVIDLTALLLGFRDRDPKFKAERTVRWMTTMGSMFPLVETNATSGEFHSTLTMPNIVTGTAGVVSATLISDSSPTKAVFTPIEIVPGKPAIINLTIQGQAYAQAHDHLLVTATVLDAHGNLVADGTSVTFSATGNAYVATFDGLTIDGIATATVKGGYASGPIVEIKVEVDELMQVFTTAPDVGPLMVQLNTPTTAAPGTQVSGVATVTTSGGVAVADAFVNFSFDGGQLEQQVFKTDALGQLPFTLHIGENLGVMQLVARADLNNPSTTTITVAGPQIATRNHDFMVSDPSGLTTTNYTGLDGQVKAVSYSNTMAVTLNGTPAANWSVNINDPYLPNHEPLALFRFKQLGLDDTGLHDGVPQQLTRSGDTPRGPGMSGVFSAGPTVTKIAVPHDATLAPNQPAVAMDIKLTTPGKVLSWGLGTLQLTVQADNSILFSVNTSTGTKQVSSAPIPLGQWVKLAAGANTSELYLSIDQTRYNLPLGGATIAYPAAPVAGAPQAKQWVGIGNGFAGQLNLLRLYNLESPQLIAISGAASGTYDVNGQATVNLLSNNTLSANRVASIGLSIDENASININLMDVQRYTAYAGLMSDVLTNADVTQAEFEATLSVQDAFPSKDSWAAKVLEQARNSATNNTMKVILAALGTSGFRDDARTLANSITALQSFYYQQNQPHMLMATADLLGEAVSLAIQGEETLFLIMQTALVVFAETVTADPAIGTFIAQAIDSKDDLWTWLRFMSLPAQGWAGPIIPVPLPDSDCAALTPTINVGTVLKYNPTPCRVKGDVMAHIMEQWIAEDSVINTEPNRMTRDLRMLNTAMIGAPIEINRLIFAVESLPVVDNGFFIRNAYAILPGLLAKTTLKTFIKIIRKHGINQLINFLRNGTDSRFEPIVIMTAIAYLESRKKGCVAKGTCQQELKPDVYKTFQSNLSVWISGLIQAKKGTIPGPVPEKNYKFCQATRTAHGAVFEIVLSAVYHALYEFGPKPEFNKFEILHADDRKNMIPFIPFKNVRGKLEATLEPKGAIERRPDLILEGDGPGKRYWIEGKSWGYETKYTSPNGKSGPTNIVGFDRWNMNKDSEANRAGSHRQFFFDRMASAGTLQTEYWQNRDYISLTEESLKPNTTNNNADSVQWWFQSWDWKQVRYYYPPSGKGIKPTTDPKKATKVNPHHGWILPKDIPLFSAKETPENRLFNALQRHFTDLPNLENGVAEATLGITAKSNKEKYQPSQIGHKKVIKPFTLAQALIMLSTGTLKDQIIDSLIAEFFPADYKKMLSGDLTAEEWQLLEEQLQQQLQSFLGPEFEKLLNIVDNLPGIPYADYWEDKIASHVYGKYSEQIGDVLSKIDIPSSEKTCDIE